MPKRVSFNFAIPWNFVIKLKSGNHNEESRLGFILVEIKCGAHLKVFSIGHEPMKIESGGL